jgi:hypothetical protein
VGGGCSKSGKLLNMKGAVFVLGFVIARAGLASGVLFTF